ncbi:transmembrane protein 116 isoform X5 [Phyllopteryx taeniolatus]|uniref:transmembrane protein 116 isoform X5 n=1 Tax=Phyllopteryx taeniolatus TaxID=161469 RepID=UPI002AD56846|nr:transmembrane protein 116 isoform X5 [Phyllopteryx taeniolatus]
MEGAFAQQNASGTQDWTRVGSALPWIHVITALVSALGSASVITRVMSQRVGGATSEVRALFLLAASDLLLALCGLLGGAMLVRHAGALAWYRLHAARQVVCIASFFYTLNYVWNVYARLRLNLWCVPHPLSAQHAMPSGKMTALLSGVAPPLLMAPVFIGGSVGGCVADCSAAYRCLLTPIGAPPVAAGRPIAACRPLRVYGGAVFLAAFLLTLVGMLALMGKCRRTYRRVVTAHGYLGNRQRASLRALDLRMLAHSLVFAVCWAPTACLVAVRATTSSTDVGGASVVVLYVAQVGCLHATFGVSARVKGHLYVRAHGRPSRRRRRASSASPRWRARAAHRDGFRRGATPTRRRRCCERRRRARGATELEDRAPPVRRHPRDSAPLRRCYCE